MNGLSLKVFLQLLVGLSLLSTNALHASFLDKETIHLGVLVKSDKDGCVERWRPTADYLKKQLRAPEVQVVCLDFDEIETAVAEKRIDFSITNPAMYVNLEYKYGASRISTIKNKRSRNAYTQLGGAIIYRSDRTDINSLEDLKGKTFMAVAENAFGGWLVSYRHLKEKGIDPKKDFKKLLFGGQQDRVVYAVDRGEVDAGCVRSDTLERMAWEQKIDLNDFEVFFPDAEDENFDFMHTTRLYPEWPLAKVKHTSQELAKQVALAMMQMPETSKAAKFSRSMGWTIPLDYHDVHDCLRFLKMPPYADYGVITLGQLYQQYKKVIIITALFLVLTFCGVALTLNLNRKLRSTLQDLDEEHKQRSQTVADLNEFKLTLDQTLDCVFMFDADSLQYIYANQGALKHVGYSEKELLLMTVMDVKIDLMEEEFREKIKPLIERTGESITYIGEHLRKDKTKVPVEVFLQHITPAGKKGRFVAIVRDITIRLEKEKEKVALQSTLVQEQKLASVGQLAAGVAHEINTPAQYLGSNIDFLKECFEDTAQLVTHLEGLVSAGKVETLSPQLFTAAEASLDEVDWAYLKEEIPQALLQSAEGVEQVSSIVLAMKNFAHPGSTEKEMTDLNELLKTTLTVSRNEWKYCATTELQFDPQLAQVNCMRNEISQVFLNIIVNAAHAISEKIGKIENGVADSAPAGECGGDKLGQITITTKNKAERVVITIADSGAGIAKENLQKIFDFFFTTKEVGKGSGQGLAIAYDIITNKHDGSLQVASEVGKGTVFTISLPVNPSPGNSEGKTND